MFIHARKSVRSEVKAFVHAGTLLHVNVRVYVQRSVRVRQDVSVCAVQCKNYDSACVVQHTATQHWFICTVCIHNKSLLISLFCLSAIYLSVSLFLLVCLSVCLSVSICLSLPACCSYRLSACLSLSLFEESPLSFTRQCAHFVLSLQGTLALVIFRNTCSFIIVKKSY